MTIFLPPSIPPSFAPHFCTLSHSHHLNTPHNRSQELPNVSLRFPYIQQDLSEGGLLGSEGKRGEGVCSILHVASLTPSPLPHSYFDVTVNPGPRLNVVIGPNGSGKSSILCAICLCLGGSPALLGRADDVREFIAHDMDDSMIEITLASKNSARGDVIRR